MMPMATLAGQADVSNVSYYESGARGRDRTADTVIFSHVLYQLSYPGRTVLEGGL